MTIYDDIRKDREAGTCCAESHIVNEGYTLEQSLADMDRHARVPQLEAIALAAEALLKAVDYCDNHMVVPAEIIDAVNNLEEASK